MMKKILLLEIDHFLKKFVFIKLKIIRVHKKILVNFIIFDEI